jgi:hypothetical protein
VGNVAVAAASYGEAATPSTVRAGSVAFGAPVGRPRTTPVSATLATASPVQTDSVSAGGSVNMAALPSPPLINLWTGAEAHTIAPAARNAPRYSPVAVGRARPTR